ncbi:MAG TPA: tetratricopeptide repeat protein [Candidatus Acidoferrales bacterium]|nr:tetratricopeptide repeat protein [Candidatus Acidoferrales bacterium]
MKYSILPVAFLPLIFVASARAQRVGPVGMRQVSAVQPVSQPTMTPRQLEELRADILVARKLYPEAIKSYEQLVKEEPKNAVLFNKLGVTFQSYGEDGPAEHAYKQAVKADKTYASAYNNVGTIEYARHKYGHAVDWYQKAITLRPDMAVVYCNLGYAYFGEKKYPEAMDAFQRAIQMDPQIMNEHGGNGTVIRQTGTTDPGLFYFFVARAYAQMGNAERCAHYLKMSRDQGYQKFVDAKTDPTFSKVITDPQVQAVFAPVPQLANSKPH